MPNFIVPKMLSFLPLELFKGYPVLEEKDKVRVQKVIKNGVGSCWKDMVLREKQEKEEQEEQEEGAGESKKSKKRKAQDADEDIDMTAELTGTQEKKTKNSQPNSKKEAENKKKADAKNKVAPPAKKAKKEDNKKGSKKLVKKEDKQQPTKVKEVKLAKDDQLELESIANEFKMLQNQ
jgi:outer membrane biosynthesis protein TonB